jgi:hypothetical protein
MTKQASFQGDIVAREEIYMGIRDPPVYSLFE